MYSYINVQSLKHHINLTLSYLIKYINTQVVSLFAYFSSLKCKWKT